MNDRSYPASPLLTLACLIIVIAGMKAAAPILNPLFLSLFIAIVCLPTLAWLNKKGVPKSLSIFLVIAVLLLTLIFLGAYLAAAIRQFTAALPDYQASLLQQSSAVFEKIQGYGLSLDRDLLTEFDVGKLMRFAGLLIAGLGDVFTNLFFILLTVLFLLSECFILPRKLQRAFGRPVAGERTRKIIKSLNQYLGIKVFTSVLTGLFISTSLYFIGVDFPGLWGVIAFMLNFVPNIGSIIAAIPTVLLAWVQLGSSGVFWVVASYFAVNMLIGNILEPKIMGKGLGLSTLVVFLSLAFWGWVFGPVGMLLSVPFTMIARIVLENDPQTRWIAVLLGPEVDLMAYSECNYSPACVVAAVGH